MVGAAAFRPVNESYAKCGASAQEMLRDGIDCKVSACGGIRICIRSFTQVLPHGILADVERVLLKIARIFDPTFVVAGLPDLAGESEFFAGAKGKSALNELHALFQ